MLEARTDSHRPVILLAFLLLGTHFALTGVALIEAAPRSLDEPRYWFDGAAALVFGLGLAMAGISFRFGSRPQVGPAVLGWALYQAVGAVAFAFQGPLDVDSASKGAWAWIVVLGVASAACAAIGWLLWSAPGRRPLAGRFGLAAGILTFAWASGPWGLPASLGSVEGLAWLASALTYLVAGVAAFVASQPRTTQQVGATMGRRPETLLVAVAAALAGAYFAHMGSLGLTEPPTSIASWNAVLYLGIDGAAFFGGCLACVAGVMAMARLFRSDAKPAAPPNV